MPDCREVVEERVKGSYACHLWNSGLAEIGYRKDVLPPQNSWLRVQFEQAGFSGEFTNKGTTLVTTGNPRPMDAVIA